MSSRYISNGIAFLPVEASSTPIQVSFVLLHNMSMLAFSSALEPLRIANQLSGRVLFQWETLSVDGTTVT